MVNLKFYKYFASSLNDNTSFKKKLDYLYFLPYLAKRNYKSSSKIAAKRGEYLSEKFELIKNNMLENISKVLNIDKKEAEKIAVNTFKEASIEELDAMILSEKNKDFLKNQVVLKNEHYVKEALNCGKGVFLAMVHAGSFASVMCKIISIFNDVSMESIAWSYKTAPCPVTRTFLHKKIEGMKYLLNGDFFFVGEMNPKKLYSALAKNNIIAIVVDSPLGKTKLLEVKYLNNTVRFPYSVIKMAHKTGAMILPLSVHREQDSYKIVGSFSKPFSVHNNNYHEYFQNLLSTLEKNIFSHPESFFYWTSPTNWGTINKL